MKQLTVSILVSLLLAPAALALERPPVGKPDLPPGTVHLQYRFGPLEIQPGQNLIDIAPNQQRPAEDGWIVGFRPSMIRVVGDTPAVGQLHLHHAVWLVDGAPQWAAGEEKTRVYAPRGFGWPYSTDQKWLLNHMIHNLTATPERVYITYQLDFVPASSGQQLRPLRTQWMDVVGGAYPVFDALRGSGTRGIYTYPEPQQAAAGQGVWEVKRDTTLLGTAAHLHPGGLWADIRLQRGGRKRLLFRSRAHYYDRRGPVSWDLSMGASRPGWRVALQRGDRISLSAAYETRRASWYEVMGIMPLLVSEQQGLDGKYAFGALDLQEQLTHGRLSENIDRGAGLPNPAYHRSQRLPDGPWMDRITIRNYRYGQGDLLSQGRAGRPPLVPLGGRLTWINRDPLQVVFHTVTGCRQPCTGGSGIGFPLADGGRWDSGELGLGPAGFTAAANRSKWTSPALRRAGTYTYFCRIHPWMRGSFRVKRRG